MKRILFALMVACAVAPVTTMAHPAIPQASIPFKIYCLNAGNLGWSQATNFANYILIDCIQNNENCFVITTTNTAVADGNPITIGTPYVQDYTGLCPDACDIDGLLGSDNITTNTSAATAAININLYQNANNGLYNYTALNATLLHQLFVDAPNMVDVILVHVYAVTIRGVLQNEIVYQGYGYINDGFVPVTGIYADSNPTLHHDVTCNNKNGPGGGHGGHGREHRSRY